MKKLLTLLLVLLLSASSAIADPFGGGLFFGKNGIGHRFVGVWTGSSQSTMSLDNGVTWINGTLPSMQAWHGIAYGNGRFVTTASLGTSAAYSFDGVTWTASTLPSTADWANIAYGNGTFCVVDSNLSSKAASSPDGITWTAQTLPSSRVWASIAYNGHVFAAVANSGVASGNVATSPDCVTWTARTGILNQDYAVSGALATLGTTFVGVGYVNRISYVSSDDGVTWATNSMSANANWTYAGANSSLVVSSGQAGTEIITTSPDGVGWTDRTAGGGVTGPVKWNGTVFCVIDQSGGDVAITSPDGITWAVHHMGFSPGAASGAALTSS